MSQAGFWALVEALCAGREAESTVRNLVMGRKEQRTAWDRLCSVLRAVLPWWGSGFVQRKGVYLCASNKHVFF